MGWAMSEIGSLIDGFTNLDKNDPYDNGLGLEDVNKVEITDKDESGITLQLVSSCNDWSEIVKVVKVTA